MLVICCGMMRSGSTLQYQIATALVEKMGKGIGIGEVRDANCRQLINAKPEHQMQVLKVHQLRHLKGVKEALEQDEAKCIYSYRDIRDVTTSLIRMRKSTFEKVTFQTQEIKECINDFYAWTSLKNVLVSRYEEMTKDLTNEVMKISHHLGLNCSLEEAQELANEFSLKKQKMRIEQWQAQQIKESVYYDPKTLLHANHINSDGKQNNSIKLTSLQIAYLDNMAEKWLKSQSYPIFSSLIMRKIAYLKYKMQNKIRRALNDNKVLSKT
jgi:hypothetical protein